MKLALRIFLFFITIGSFNGAAWASYSSNDFLNELRAVINNAGGEFVFEKEKEGELRERISSAQINFTIDQFFEANNSLNISIKYDHFIIEQVSDNKISLELSAFSHILIKSKNFLGDSFDLLIELKQTPITIFLERTGDVRNFFLKQAFLSQEVSRVFLNGSQIPIGFEIKLKDYLYSVHVNRDSQRQMTIYEVESEIQDLSIFSEIIDSQIGIGTQVTRVNNENVSSKFNLTLPDLEAIFSFIDKGINPLEKGLLLGIIYERTAGSSETIISNQDFNILTRIEDRGVLGGLGVSKNGINFLGQILDLRLSFLSSEFSNLPLKTEFDEFTIEMEFPLLNKKNGSPFKFYINIDDLLLSESIWDFAGIGNDFYKQPIAFQLDTSGDINWLLNLMDLKELESFSENSPIELNNLNINAFKISFGEVEINGSGSFVFLNKEFQALGGFGLPQPVGEIRVELKGAYRFVDELMSKNIIDKQTGIFILGLITVYTTSGNEDDNLLSVIRITESGEILINNKSLQ